MRTMRTHPPPPLNQCFELRDRDGEPGLGRIACLQRPPLVGLDRFFGGHEQHQDRRQGSDERGRSDDEQERDAVLGPTAALPGSNHGPPRFGGVTRNPSVRSGTWW